MNINDISFPHLGIYLKNVPKNITVFGFPIAFYGIIIGLGMLIAVFTAAKEAKNRGMDSEFIWDMAVYGIIFGILGARIYYVAMKWDQYKDNLLSIFNTRQGGLAIYGGVIGGFLTIYIYGRIKKIKFLTLADFVAPGLLIGQLMGRWGNFFNREVFGGYTDNLFAMRLPIDAVRASDITPALAATIEEGANYIQVAPTFLYESLWNLGILLIIICYRKHKRFEGELFLIYLFGYGIGRFWIEAIRTDQLFIPGTQIPVSMAVAAATALASLVAWLVLWKKAPRTQYVVGEINKPVSNN